MKIVILLITAILATCIGPWAKSDVFSYDTKDFTPSYEKPCMASISYTACDGMCQRIKALSGLSRSPV